jgi:peptide/nickel transport system permease protein
VILAVGAPALSPVDPLKQFRDGLANDGTPLPPSERFPMGTDHLGRDMLSRMLYGAQVSLTITFVANLVAALFGTLVGVTAGYY